MKDNWINTTIGDICESYAGGTPNRSNSEYYKGNIPWISSGEVNQSYIFQTKEKISKDGLKFSSAKWIPKEAILIAMYGATAGQVAKLKIDATSNQAVLALIPKETDDYFLYHLLNFIKPQILFLAQGSGQPNLSKSIVDNTKIIIPPLPQQRKIAKILTTCDAVIEKTEAAIAKYQAMKQGLMHDLFTRGIDVNTGKLLPKQEDAPHLYKESELGWIPKEWEVKKLEDLCSEKPKYGINAAAVEFNNNLPIYLRITDIDVNGNFSKTGRKSVDNPFSDQYYLKKGDIVFARTGATVGKTYLYNENDGALVYAGFLIKASPNKNLLDADFLKFLTETSYYLNWVVLMSQRSGQPGINGAEYGSLKISIPNITEQKIISERLLIALKKIQTEQSALSKYQQLKKGLMQDLLSGKVEVKV